MAGADLRRPSAVARSREPAKEFRAVRQWDREQEHRTYSCAMNWQELDFPTRAGFIAGVMAVIGLIVPPLSIASAVVAIGFSGVGWQRSRTQGQANPVAKYVLLVSTALIVLVVVGNAIYSSSS